MDKKLQLKEYIDKSNKTIAVTGAGISYLYGMRRLKEKIGYHNLRKILSAEYVRKYPADFYATMKYSFLDATFRKGPGKVHKQLAEMECRGLLKGIITNNMDCLHTIAGSKNIVEIEGGFGENICIACGERLYDYSVWNQGTMPLCPNCSGALMPVNFCWDSKIREQAFRSKIKEAQNLISDADLVLIIGTTGYLSEEYMNKISDRTKIVQINLSETKFDSIADLSIYADAAEVLAYVLNENN